MAKIPIALQMYTLRNETARDFAGTLRQVAQIGYAGVEFAGTGGLTAAELRRLLQDLHLKVAASHVDLDTLENRLPEALDYNQELGNRFIVCPWLPENRRQSGDAYRALAGVLNRIGAACKERGFQLCYHNHAFEFERFDGQYGLDILLGATDPALVKAEIDTYWVEKGGEDAVDYIRRYAGRCPLVHLKDMSADKSRTFAEVGEGTIEWPEVFAAADAAGTQWYIVEQDTCQRPPLASIATSLRNLRAMGQV